MKSGSPVKKAQIVYFSHGGGPLPILGDPGHAAMVDFMRELPAKLRRPDAILVISAHWEESVPTLLGADNPPMFYGYYGFPDESYQITYPARIRSRPLHPIDADVPRRMIGKTMIFNSSDYVQYFKLLQVGCRYYTVLPGHLKVPTMNVSGDRANQGLDVIEKAV
jgi:hypothetical protein